MSAMDAKVLRRAAELVEMGHCKGVLSVDVHGVGICDPLSARAVGWCVRGAMLRALHEVVGLDLPGAWVRLDRLEPDCLDPVLDGAHPVYWNNAPERTADEVAAALRAAADRCEVSERSEAVPVNPVPGADPGGAMSKASEWAKRLYQVEAERPRFVLSEEHGASIEVLPVGFVPAERAVHLLFKGVSQMHVDDETAMKIGRWILDTFGEPSERSEAQP